MPYYNYRTSSGEEFVVFQRMADPPLTTHPETGEPCERTLPSGVNAIDYTDAGAKTVGQQAERNMRRMGREAVEAAQEKHTPKRKRPKWLPGSGEPPDIRKIKDKEHFIRTGEVR
jgi:predicted nucleic acid-binding Zn ribbon protein